MAKQRQHPRDEGKDVFDTALQWFEEHPIVTGPLVGAVLGRGLARAAAKRAIKKRGYGSDAKTAKLEMREEGRFGALGGGAVGTIGGVSYADAKAKEVQRRRKK